MAKVNVTDTNTGLPVPDLDLIYAPIGSDAYGKLVVDVGISSTKTNVTGDGTEWKIQYDNNASTGIFKIYNPLGIWDTSTYEGTIPSGWGGYYLIRAGWHLGSTPGIVSTNNRMTLKVVRNSGGLTDWVCRTIGNVYSYNNNQSAELIDVDDIILPLAVADDFWVTLKVEGTGKGIGFQNDYVTRLQAIYLGSSS